MIKKGDTINQIANAYHINVLEIMKLNPGLNPYNLLIGQQICIPQPIFIYPNCPTTNYYVVKNNDTIQGIAQFFSVSLNQLNIANYGIDLHDLYEGQILCLPVSKPVTQILINSSDHRLFLFKNNEVIKIYPILSLNPHLKGQLMILNKQIDSPLFGARYLGLSEPNVGIHGINSELQVSQNSISLSNEDMNDLFNYVTVGTQVLII